VNHALRNSVAAALGSQRPSLAAFGFTPSTKSTASPSELYALLDRALCHGDGDDADRAALALYRELHAQMNASLPGREEHTPSLTATLILAMARHHLST
jgi:hypothetical protein